MAWIATAVLGSAAIGAAAKAYSSSQASKAQKEAADKAAGISTGMYEQTRADLAPYRAIGDQAATDLSGRLTDLTAPIVMDQATLEATPGYQFNLQQGLKATQNSAAARGLGSSGAALKGAAAFATGLADSTYQNQFNNARANKTDAFNRLKSLVDTGSGAAAATGSAGTAAAKTASDAAIQGGNAEAAGANALGASVSKFADDVAGYAAYRGAGNPLYKVGTNGPYGVPTYG